MAKKKEELATELVAVSTTPEKTPEPKCMYVVGIDANGKFVFQIGGTSMGLIELLGLHKFAEHKIQEALETSLDTGHNKTLGSIKQLTDVVLKLAAK